MGDRLGLCSNPGDHLAIAFLFAFVLQDQTVIEVQCFLKELLPAVLTQSGACIKQIHVLRNFFTHFRFIPFKNEFLKEI